MTVYVIEEYSEVSEVVVEGEPLVVIQNKGEYLRALKMKDNL